MDQYLFIILQTCPFIDTLNTMGAKATGASGRFAFNNFCCLKKQALVAFINIICVTLKPTKQQTQTLALRFFTIPADNILIKPQVLAFDGVRSIQGQVERCYGSLVDAERSFV